MKKLLVSVLAIAGLVACSQEQTLVSKSPASMEFGVASLDKATRVDPSLTDDNLQGFNVWAWMDSEDGNVLTAEDVERMGKGWGYVNTAYWLPGHYYSFAALAPMDSANWTYNLNVADNGEDNTIDFKNIDGTEDLIYAFNTRSTVGEPVGKDYPVLDLTFNHLLSKTKFTFVNGFATDNVTVQVTDVKMTAKNTATYSIEKKAWGEVTGEEITLAYGDTEVIAAGDKCVVADERLTIPAAAATSYEITYTVQVWYGKEPGFKPEGLTKTTTLTGWEFVQGKAYNFVAEITPESLNLDEIEFTVVVNEWDEQDVNVGQIEDEVKFVTTIDELQKALNAATGDTTVVLGADLKGNVTVPELAGATIAIVGNDDYTFDGTFALVGGSTYGKGTTVFDGINFETAALNGYDAFIYCNEQNGNTRYPDNVTIKNCTFKGTDIEAAVAAKFRSLNGNLVVENCKAEGIHSMLQLSSCGEAVVLVDGVEVKDCGRGFSLQNSTNTIRNTNVTAAYYGVRLQGGVATTSIEDSTIEATQPVIVRKVTTAGYTVNVDAATELKTAEAFQVIFTKGDDEDPYVAPEVAFTFNGPAATVVFPNNYAAAASVEDLYAALANEEASVVVLESDVNVSATTTPWVNVNREVYINTDENTLTVGNPANYGLFCNAGSDVTLDADIVAQGGALVARDGAQVVFNSGSVKIESASTSQRYVVYAYGAGTTVTINGGTFSFEAYKKRAYGYIADGATLYINGGVFGAASNHPTDPTAPFTGNVVIKGGTFGFNPSAWVADGYVATQNGSTWTVSKQ